MPQIFHRSFNTIARASIVGVVLLIAAIGFISWRVNRSAYITYVKEPLPQPVPFSHRHHTVTDGIDCRYCHTTVETSWYAGMPSTHTCMTCHSQLWVHSPMLAPVRASYREDKPIEWTRVNTLPDFVYFNHAIHIHKGIGCTTCHGQIGKMAITYRAHTLYMRWCLSCHNHPARYVRPRAQVFDPIYHRPSEKHPLVYEGVVYTRQMPLGRLLVKKYRIQSLISCDTCHR